jgi:uncharacterized protein YhaN
MKMPEPTEPRADPTEEGTTTGEVFQRLRQALAKFPHPTAAITDASGNKWTITAGRLETTEAQSRERLRQALDKFAHRTEEGTTAADEALEAMLAANASRTIDAEKIAEMIRRQKSQWEKIRLELQAEDMFADIDAIVKRLDEGIPRLNARLDELLECQRRPLTV